VRQPQDRRLRRHLRRRPRFVCVALCTAPFSPSVSVTHPAHPAELDTCGVCGGANADRGCDGAHAAAVDF
jgi:hypothetical protein